MGASVAEHRTTYNLEDFVQACAKGEANVLKPAIRSAERDFGLMSPADILDWIGAGGIEKPQHANTAPWKNNPHPDRTVLVDSYDFYSGTTYGYLAFLYQPLTGRWILKSLKKNDKPSPRAFLLAEKLRDAGRVPN